MKLSDEKKGNHYQFTHHTVTGTSMLSRRVASMKSDSFGTIGISIELLIYKTYLL